MSADGSDDGASPTASSGPPRRRPATSIRVLVEAISGQTTEFRLCTADTVFELKQRIYSTLGIAVAEQNLTFLDQELKDSCTLADYHMKDCSRIRLSVPMKGGPVSSRRTFYFNEKDSIGEMAKMLAAGNASLVLVPHNGTYHVVPIPAEKKESDTECLVLNAAQGSNLEQRRRHASKTSSSDHASFANASSICSDGPTRRCEDNTATKNKMAALQKQLKKKRSAPSSDTPSALVTILHRDHHAHHHYSTSQLRQHITDSVTRQTPEELADVTQQRDTMLVALSRPAGSCGSNLQKSILADSMPPSAAASSVVLVGAGVGGGPEPPRKVVVPRLISAHNSISFNVHHHVHQHHHHHHHQHHSHNHNGHSEFPADSNRQHPVHSSHTENCSGGTAHHVDVVCGGRSAFEASSAYGSKRFDRGLLLLYPTMAAPTSRGVSSRHNILADHRSCSNRTPHAIFVTPPCRGLFRCTADTTENASKEDVPSGGGRCSSAAAAPPPPATDTSPTVVERPAAVVPTTTSTSSQPPAPSGGVTSGSGGSAVSSVSNKPLVHSATTQQKPQQPVEQVVSTKDETKVERGASEEATGGHTIVTATASSAASAVTDGGSGTSSSTKDAPAEPAAGAELSTPAAAVPPKKKHPRCAVCNKKTGLASSYSCRCGGNFCASHRYAEAHDCGHDYKTEGRQQLEKNNPLIQAAKLHKI